MNEDDKPKKRGRPPLADHLKMPAHLQRTHAVKVRFNDAEHERLLEAAGGDKRKRPEVIREALDEYVGGGE